MRTLQGHPIRILGALLALIVAFCCATVGVANAADAAGESIVLGADEPTTTITVDGTPIELIPAASAELPPETSSLAADSGIEVQGASSSTGPTAAAGVDAPISMTWVVLGALVILGGAVLWVTRLRRAARH